MEQAKTSAFTARVFDTEASRSGFCYNTLFNINRNPVATAPGSDKKQ